MLSLRSVDTLVLEECLTQANALGRCEPPREASDITICARGLVSVGRPVLTERGRDLRCNLHIHRVIQYYTMQSK